MRTLKKELWPHKVNIKHTHLDEIEIWLGKTLGPFKEQWNAVYRYNSTDFYFKQGQDATMFMLRWS
jgi:hypothetical protein